jgi:uncharacterized protein YehS (DUF1456 family)
MDITHSSWKITKLHYAKVYDERDHRREGADGLDAVPESRLKECLQKGWVTDRMSPTDESERLFGVERGVKANFVLQKISTEDFRAECSFSERNSSDLARV